MRPIKHRLRAIATTLPQLIIANLPLMMLWIAALAAPAVGDLPKLWELEFPTVRYVLGLLRIMACSTGLAVVVAAVIAITATKRWIRWPLATLAMVLIGIYAFLMTNYHSRLTPEVFTFIAETTSDEAGEYAATFVLHGTGLILLLTLVAVLVVWIVLDIRWQRRTHTATRRTTVAVWTVLALALTGAACAPSTWSLAASLVRADNREFNDAFGLDVISNVMFCCHSMQLTDRLTENAIDATRKACETPVTMPDDAPTVVLVIGESYIKSHAAIYGYSLPTTPRMSRERDNGNLWAFNQAVSQFSNTNMAVRNILSTNSIAQGEEWQQQPIFPALFKRAGYQVDLWDNQREFFRESAYTRGLNAFIYNPEVMALCFTHHNRRNYDYDAPLIDHYTHSPYNTGKCPRLVIFHLRGQHVMASRRYPHHEGFDRFTPADYTFRTDEFLTRDMLEKIAHYDNATLYNDHVVGMIFDAFRDCDAAVVYVSDHGDEVYDYRPSMGRRPDEARPEAARQYQNHVPLVVWCSPTYTRRRPAIVKRLTDAINRPVSTDNVAQLIMSLATLRSPYYHPERDPLGGE